MSSRKPDATLSSRRSPSARKKVRGRPFASGADGRRNLKGRGKTKAPPSILGEIVDVLMEPVPITRNGKRTRVPKIRGLLEQQLGKGIHGDQTALRNAATLIRAVAGLTKPAVPSGHSVDHSVHDERALRRLIDTFENQIREADRQREREGRDDE